MKSEARSNQLITFARCLREALPIQYRDLPSAARNQTGTFELPGSIRDGWPLDTQHFGEQALSDLQCVIVSAVTHHKQPTRQPLLETVRPVARYRQPGPAREKLGRKRTSDFGTTASTPWPV